MMTPFCKTPGCTASAATVKSRLLASSTNITLKTLDRPWCPPPVGRLEVRSRARAMAFWSTILFGPDETATMVTARPTCSSTCRSAKRVRRPRRSGARSRVRDALGDGHDARVLHQHVEAEHVPAHGAAQGGYALQISQVQGPRVHAARVLSAGLTRCVGALDAAKNERPDETAASFSTRSSRP